MNKGMKKVIIAIVAVIVLGISGGYIFTQSMLNRVPKKELPKTNEELGITSSKKSDDMLNIVFFGLDRRNPDQASRSDSIMVVSIDKKNQKIKVSSLMRDMYVPIPSKGSNRINAAYAFGGPALAIKTINSNFETDIRDYVTIDFFGLEDLVDKVGGVNINVKPNEVDRCYVSSSGLQNLNGKQALAYSRIRYVGHGDYERTERQRRVLNELFKKIKAQGITKLPGIISTVLPYVETSLSNGDIMNIAMDAAKFNTEDLDQFRLPVDGSFKSQKIRGMAVLVPNIVENKDKLHEFIYGKKEQ